MGWNLLCISFRDLVKTQHIRSFHKYLINSKLGFITFSPQFEKITMILWIFYSVSLHFPFRNVIDARVTKKKGWENSPWVTLPFMGKIPFFLPILASVQGACIFSAKIENFFKKSAEAILKPRFSFSLYRIPTYIYLQWRMLIWMESASKLPNVYRFTKIRKCLQK